MFIDPDNPLAAEILQEAGEVYFSACKKMVSSLETLRAFDSAVGSSLRDDERAARRSQLLHDAAERVWWRHSIHLLRPLPSSRLSACAQDYMPVWPLQEKQSSGKLPYNSGSLYCEDS